LNYSSENGITVTRYWELKEPESFNGKLLKENFVDRIADLLSHPLKGIWLRCGGELLPERRAGFVPHLCPGQEID
jgi:hypothetical protein